MGTTRRPVPLVLLVLALTIGCGTRSPVAPSDSESTPNGDVGVPPQLHVSTFSLAGWYSDKYHYIPTLAVTSSSKGWINIERLEFREGGPDVPASEDVLSSIHYHRQPQRLPPGTTVELSPAGSVLDFTSDVELSAVTVTVTFSDVNGRSHTVSAVAQAPSVSENRSAAELAIQSFTVDGWVGSGGRHHYWPKLRLTEMSGRSHVIIRQMTFELLDVGVDGRIPTVNDPLLVGAGGSISLSEDAYGWGPWLEIDSRAMATRVSLTVLFQDASGLGGSVSAVAQVTR